jgi:putative flippase GtrA
MKKYKPLLYEFIRYLIVGGTAFLVDFGVLVLFNSILPELFGFRLYIATALGFAAGLVFNYIFSVLFVFKSARNRKTGRSPKAFALFALIGVVGLGLTELGMYTGTELLDIHYMLVKIVVTAIVLMWNYLGRKFFVFKSPDGTQDA